MPAQTTSKVVCVNGQFLVVYLSPLILTEVTEPSEMSARLYSSSSSSPFAFLASGTSDLQVTEGSIKTLTVLEGNIFVMS